VVTDPLGVALAVTDVLERCGLRYLADGSLASSLSGEPRSTLDVDQHAVLRAVRARSSVNLIHHGTSTKVDIFVLGGTPLDEEQMARRVAVKVASAPDRLLWVYTPEDIFLQKLRWYRRGNEVSDRQWRDVLGIIAVQRDRLDLDYLRRGADVLAVADASARTPEVS
jgi:hypothetical protein